MKRQAIALFLISSLGLLSWVSAQGTRTDLYDVKKSQQELEVMKGILSTTLGFVANELRNREAAAQSKPGEMSHRFRMTGFSGGASVSAYYLYGQGATFVIPVSSLSIGSGGMDRVFALASGAGPAFGTVGLSTGTGFDSGDNLVESLESASERLEEAQEALQDTLDAQQELQAQQMELEETRAEAKVSTARPASKAPKAATPATSQDVGVPAPPAPPPPPAVAHTPKPPRNQEQMRKRLADAQEKVKRRREELETRRQKLLQSLSEIKVYLIEALANHGDSLTFLKPNEYINIILTTDEGFPLFSDSGESRALREVISVQKSVVSDYKAGRVTLDAFKQKVLQYSN